MWRRNRNIKKFETLVVVSKKSRFCVSNVCVALDEGIIPKVLHSGYGCVSFVAVVVVGG